MIAFDLRCGGGHVFEAWFASGASYEQQAAGGLIACPLCSDTSVRKAAMAPAVGRKGNRSSEVGRPGAGVASGLDGMAAGEVRGAADTSASYDASAALRALAARQAEVLRGSSWVGDAFAARARAMNDGDEVATPIHGRATLDDAVALAKEGIPVAPLPFPVVPPKQLN